MIILVVHIPTTWLHSSTYRTRLCGLARLRRDHCRPRPLRKSTSSLY